MRSRLGLVALWALFAAASVGVGFGAAGLVGDPFTDPGGDQVTLTDGGESSVTPVPAGSPTSVPPSSRSTPSSAASPGSTSGSRAVGSPSSSLPAAPVVRSLTTRGGLVSGSCSRGLVTISAAPTVGWAIKDADGGPTQEARVRFERTGSGDGRVEVRAHCAGGVPRFSVDDRTGDSSGPGDDGGSSQGGHGSPGPG